MKRVFNYTSNDYALNGCVSKPALLKSNTFKCTFFAFILLSLPVYATVPEYIADEGGAVKSVKEREGLLDDAFGDKMENKDEPSNHQFLDDSTLKVKPRLYYFDRQGNTVTGGTTTAIGGELEYKSGWWKKRLRFSTSGYTSQKLYADDGINSTLLLQPNQDAINSLAKIYIDVNITDKIRMRGGRVGMNLPFINKRDSRMVPITHEGVGIGGDINDALSFVAGHITKVKNRNSESFISMSEAAGALGTKEPLTLMSLRYGKQGSWNISAMSQYTWNTMNTIYSEGNFNDWSVKGAEVGLSVQYTKQESVGENLIGEFDLDSYGARFSTSYKYALFNLAYTTTKGSGNSISNPYGGSPSFLSLMIKDFDRAGENSWLLGSSYDFGLIGAPGLSAVINYAEGRSSSHGKRSEIDATVDYKFQSKELDGLWLRLRWGDLKNRGNSVNDITDARVIINYKATIF